MSNLTAQIENKEVGNFRKGLPSCSYNQGVECSLLNRHCNRCGWNPDVAAKRSQRRKLNSSSRVHK